MRKMAERYKCVYSESYKGNCLWGRFNLRKYNWKSNYWRLEVKNGSWMDWWFMKIIWERDWDDLMVKAMIELTGTPAAWPICCKSDRTFWNACLVPDNASATLACIPSVACSFHYVNKKDKTNDWNKS